MSAISIGNDILIVQRNVRAWLLE